MMLKKSLNIPNILTLVRLVLSPLLLPALIVFLGQYEQLTINALLALIFLLFGFTDFLDGYFARRYHQETAVGELLDPIADKLLVSSVLIALVAAHKLHFYWAILFVCREFFVTGLRYLALERGDSLPVSTFAKIKTAAQIVCLTFVIINPHSGHGFFTWFAWNGMQLFLLAVTVGISVFSAHGYYREYCDRYIDDGASDDDIKQVEGSDVP